MSEAQQRQPGPAPLSALTMLTFLAVRFGNHGSRGQAFNDRFIDSALSTVDSWPPCDGCCSGSRCSPCCQAPLCRSLTWEQSKRWLADLDDVANEINNRPRKTLTWV